MGFLNVLATPSSFVVDRAVIHRFHDDTKDIGTNAAAAIGTGPFLLKDWVLGQKMDLVRNPRYYLRADWPYADGVREDLGVDASIGVLRIERGQSDLLADPIPAAQFAGIIQSPTLSKLVASAPDVGDYLIGLNVRVKPFDKLLVRRAVSYAINKMHTIRFVNGRGIPATGILPPNLPGFNGAIPDPYPYSPAKAKHLLAQAGYPNGFSTTMGVPRSGYEQRMGDAVIDDLRQVGIRVAIKPVITEGTAVPTLPMIAYRWLMDYPDPADFIDGFTNCSEAVPGGTNVSFYCNHTVDRRAAAARGMPQGPARVTTYKHIDQLIMADAPAVVVFHDLLYYMHSARLQGYYVSPEWYPYTLEQYWLSS